MVNILILYSYGTTVVYAVRLWPKRLYVAHTFVLFGVQVEELPDILWYRMCIADRIFHSKLKHLVDRDTSERYGW